MTADRYRESGVDISAGDELVRRIKKLAASTFTGAEIGGIGGFGGLFALDVKDYRAPVLVASADGVGTKLKIAVMCGKFDTVGIDLVAMCVNDILTSGAKPIFFLDYFAAGKISADTGEAVLRGIAEGCRRAGCSLLGGETAEMPGVYSGDDFDLAGFCVGIADREKIIDGSRISPGDLIVGLPSSGIHSNGYSLARKVFFEEKGLSVNDRPDGLDCAVGEELLRPTVIYSRQIEAFAGVEIRGMAHITGGGWTGNLSRILPGGCSASFEKDSWEVPGVFSFLEREGGISRDEMFGVFNMGVGFMLVVPARERGSLPPFAKVIGRIDSGSGEVNIP